MYVDLGLTSGTKWATWDYGATAVGEIGSYVSCNDQNSKSKRPTQAQAQELIDECDWLLRSGGWVVKSKINNNVLFLSFSGYQRQEVVSGSLMWVTNGKGISCGFWTKDSITYANGNTSYYLLNISIGSFKISSSVSYKRIVRYVKK